LIRIAKRQQLVFERSPEGVILTQMTCQKTDFGIDGQYISSNGVNFFSDSPAERSGGSIYLPSRKEPLPIEIKLPTNVAEDVLHAADEFNIVFRKPVQFILRDSNFTRFIRPFYCGVRTHAQRDLFEEACSLFLNLDVDQISFQPLNSPRYGYNPN
jgi:hypothetical protein